MSANPATRPVAACWCGNRELAPFSEQYRRCPRCETLVTVAAASGLARVVDDERDFYGRDYWFAHQRSDLGQADIESRARTDLPERCLHWLRALLRYKAPPGRVLELGSAHGGFVALMRWAGFDATGLELSPWVADFAHRTFDVPTLQGPLEEQSIPEGSLDAIALMDVLEHLADPAATMAHALRLLRPDGILLIQTPRYPEGAAHGDMTARQDRFLEQLKATEHLYLFSERSVRQLFDRLGAPHVAFEPALFAHYDMCVVVSRSPLRRVSPEDVAAALRASSGGRLVEALSSVDTDLAAARAEAADVYARLGASEKDRGERLRVIEEQGRRLGRVESERNELAARAEALERALADVSAALSAAEADRAARLEVIERQAREFSQALSVSEADRAARLDVIHRQGHDVAVLRRALADIQGRYLYKVLGLLGAWGGLDAILAAPPPGPPTPYEEAFARIRVPKKKGGVGYSKGAERRIAKGLRARGIEVRDYRVDVAGYRRYLEAARYAEDHPTYYSFNLPEKSLEHYLAATLLDLGPEDVYIDVASEHSPVPDIYGRIFGARTFRQDLAYPAGLDGDRIGGSAAAMPVPDGMATKMALHCSFEHFEGRADIDFVREAGRVLRPGGRLFIGPLYLHEEYAIQTDPVVAVAESVAFEEDAVIHAAPGWGNRHGRFYDPEHLASRIHRNLGGLRLVVYRIVNAAEVDPTCYIRFAAVMDKPGREDRSRTDAA